MTTRIVLADDHTMFRETLRLTLELEKDIQVVAEASTGKELLDQLPAIAADVLILDIGLPDMSGVAVARHVAKSHPGLKVIALSGYTERIFVEEMMKAGASAFVAKSAGSRELLFAIDTVIAGKVFISPEVSMAVVRHMASPAPGETPPISVLSGKEQEVLRLVAEGNSSPEIAAILEIATATVNVHRRNIKQKLNLSSVADLTRYAIREGLIAVE